MGVQPARFAEVAPNASQLPYQLRLKGWRLAGVVCAAGMGVLAGLVGGMLVLSVLVLPHKSPLVLGFVGLVLLLLGLAGALRLWSLRTAEIELFPDRLVTSTMFGPRPLNRSDIAGVGRNMRSRYGAYFDIVTRPNCGDSLRFDASLRNDPIFAEWLSGAPDPAVVARESDRASVLADSRYGATAPEREARLKLARQIVIGFSVVCFVIAAWLGFFQPPALIALGAASVCIAAAFALVGGFQGLIVWRSKYAVRPTVIAAVLPAAALALHGLFSVDLLAIGPLLIAAAVIGAGAALLFFQQSAGTARRGSSALVLGVFAAVLAYGAGVYLDALNRNHPDRSFVVTVENKHESSGRSTTYYLDLDAWGDQPAKSVSVSSDLYNAVDTGSAVCIDRYRGDLRLPWFTIGLCKAPPPQAPLPSPPPGG